MTRVFAVSVLAGATVGLASLSAQTQTIPRTADGKPNLSGMWQVVNSAVWDIQDHSAANGVPAGQGVVEGNELPYLPAALGKRKENFQNRLTRDTERDCLLPGVPRITYMPFPFQIVQTPKEVALLYEYAHAARHVYMDTPHLADGITWWMGDSRGRWEGDTLVVDVNNFNDKTWFDRSGNFHSDALHVIERYTLIDKDHIYYEATIEDPRVFSRPWKMSMPLYRRIDKSMQLLDYECYAFDDYVDHGNGPGRN